MTNRINPGRPTPIHSAVAGATVLALTVVAAMAAEPGAGRSPRPPIVGAQRVVIDPATGNPSLVRFAPEGRIKTEGGAEHRARVAIHRHAAGLGLKGEVGELALVEVRRDPLGGEQAIFRQVHHGLPVFGSLLRVHFDIDGALTTINGTIVPDLAVDPLPMVDAHVAEAEAVRWFAKGHDLEKAPIEVAPARLLIYRTNLIRGLPGANRLAWEIEVATPPHRRETLYLDAHDGRLLDRRSEIRHLERTIHLGDYPNPIWREGDSRPYSSGSPERDAEINELIDATGDAHALFANLTAGQYLSFDGNDATMHSVYDADSIDCPNAVESGGLTAFCVGMVSDDVAAHEWTHAYTEWTHGLVYQWQPGALNEAYSDIFGELADLLNGRGTDAPGGPRPPANCSIAGGSPQPTLTIISPPGIAGPYAAGGAVFNPPPPWTVTAAVELVDDGTGVPSDACEPIAGFQSGRIALIDRGTCLFRDKVLEAQGVGAVGVIIVNNQDNDVFEMGGELTRLDIPAVLVGRDDGQRLKDALGQGVTATLDLDGSLVDSVRWIIGEDTAALGAIRDMWTPTCFDDPDRVGSGSYACAGDIDNGGVHTNSGVANHAFALLVDGGSFNGRQIGSIGVAKAAQIYWRAMASYQTPVTGFAAHADALHASCEDLLGAVLYDPATGLPSGQTVVADDCVQVEAAVAAVELRDFPVQCGFTTLLDPDAPPVEGNVVLLDEGFDADPGAAWPVANRGVFPEYSPRDWGWTDEPPPGGDGGAFFAVDSVLIGDCQPGSDDQSGVMELTSPTVEIPRNATGTVLSFDHWIASEPAYDGGNLKLSVNGGPFTEIPRSAFSFNPYNDRIVAGSNSNPLAGQWAFTGTDQGSYSGSWGQSQVELAALVAPGDRIALRFDLGVDGCNGAVGWYVDNVRLVATASGPRRSGGRVRP
jgi:Zn-dependent metalloprotease